MKPTGRAAVYRRHYVKVGGRPRCRWVCFQYGNQTFNVGPEFGSMREAEWFADQLAKCLGRLVDDTVAAYNGSTTA